MVRIDPQREVLVNRLAQFKTDVEYAKFSLFCYDNHEKLYKLGLSQGKAYGFGTLDDVLVSEKPIERCVFDNGKLEMIAPIIGESAGIGKERIWKTIYECKKCKIKYISQLTKKEEKDREKRMREMVFA